MGMSNADVVGKNYDSQPTFGYRIDDCWTCEQQLRRSTVQFVPQIATHHIILFITACSMDDHDEEKRREHNLIACGCKSGPNFQKSDLGLRFS